MVAERGVLLFMWTHSIIAVTSTLHMSIRHPFQVGNDIAEQEETFSNTPDLLEKYGYPVESHQVITEDGHILTLHRIPYGLRSPASASKPPVLVQHGFLSNSAELLLNGPDQALGYVLADAGYDVWLGNTRGNRYSHNHTVYRTDEPEYWDFSWADMGYYDVPAMIDHVLNVTQQAQLFYIGYSRGSTVFFTMCITRPEYNDKVRLMVALAPIAYLSHAGAPIAWHLISLQKMFRVWGMHKYNPSRAHWQRFGREFCNDGNLLQYICQAMFFIIAGYDPENFNATLMPTILEHQPDTIVTKDMEHFAQAYTTGTFRAFDYGAARNMRIYNAVEPPPFNLSKVTVPVVLFYSDNDYHSDVQDVEQLYAELSNPVTKVLIPGRINHYSFLYGKQIREMLYDQVLAIMQYY